VQAESQRTVACRPVLSHRTHQRIKSSQAAHTVGNASPLITCPRLTNHAGIHPFEFLVVGRGRANAIGTAGVLLTFYCTCDSCRIAKKWELVRQSYVLSKLEGKEIPLLLQEAVKVEWN
jgi:hypothetical protein